MHNKFIALLRGINVGGHHKVPMARLREEMERLGFSNVSTLLNSGNVIFEADSSDIKDLERLIGEHLKNAFGFAIPIWVYSASDIQKIVDANPFQAVNVSPDTRLYVSFLRESANADLHLPWRTEDNAFQIIGIQGRVVFSVLDVSVTQTTKGMDMLEQLYGKDMTTRNWNTVIRLQKKLI